MGTINYGTSKYITMGYYPIDRFELEQDDSFMNEMRWSVDEYGGTLDYAIDEYITDCEAADFRTIRNIINKYSFNIFSVSLECGYYDGFYINIGLDYIFDNWAEKREAQKEATALGNLLRECANNGLVECFPGWGTSYSNHAETLRAIEKAVKAMREDIKNAPTYRTLRRGKVIA